MKTTIIFYACYTQIWKIMLLLSFELFLGTIFMEILTTLKKMYFPFKDQNIYISFHEL